MADLNGFNAAEVAPTSFDVLPSGEYDVCIVGSEMKSTKNGAGKMLNLELQILSGEYQNRKLFDNLNLDNPSTKAVEIARGTLSAICRAVGVLTPRDSAELHNKPLRIKLSVEKSEEYGEQNRIKAYKPRQTGPAFSPPPAAAAPAVPANVDPNATPW